MLEGSKVVVDPGDPSTPSSPDLLDLTCIRDRLLSAAQADGCRSQCNLNSSIDVLFFDVMSRLSTLSHCAAQIQHANEIVAENRHEMELYRQYVISLEKCIAEQAAREVYMKGQVDRRNATLSEQRNEFYEQLLALKTLITENDVNQRLHNQQLHGTTLRDYPADHRPILQRMGSQITFNGDGRIEAAEWNRLLQEARAKLDNRTKTFELQMNLVKEELHAAKQQSTNLAELVDRYQKQLKEQRDHLRTLKLEKAADDAKAAEQIQDLQVRIRLLEERLENSVSSVTVSKALQQGDINMRSQISAMTRAREELERQQYRCRRKIHSLLNVISAEEVRGLKEAFAVERKHWKQKEEQMTTNFSTQIFKLEQASRQQQAISQIHRVGRLTRDSSLLKATVPDANKISFDSTSQPSLSKEQTDSNRGSETTPKESGHSSESAQRGCDTGHIAGRIAAEANGDQDTTIAAAVDKARKNAAQPTKSQRSKPAGGHRRARSDGTAFVQNGSSARGGRHARELYSQADSMQIPEMNEMLNELESPKPSNISADEFDQIDHQGIQAMIDEIHRDAAQYGANDKNQQPRYRDLDDLIQPNSDVPNVGHEGHLEAKFERYEQDKRSNIGDPNLEDYVMNDGGDRQPSQSKGVSENTDAISRASSKQSSTKTSPTSSTKTTPFVSRLPSRIPMVSSIGESDLDPCIFDEIDEARRRSNAAWDLVLINSRATQCDLDDCLAKGTSNSKVKNEAKQRRAIHNWKSLYQFVLLQHQSGQIDAERAKRRGERKHVRQPSSSPTPRSGTGSKYSNNTPRSMRIIFDDDPDRPIYRVMTPRVNNSI